MFPMIREWPQHQLPSCMSAKGASIELKSCWLFKLLNQTFDINMECQYCFKSFFLFLVQKQMIFFFLNKLMLPWEWYCRLIPEEETVPRLEKRTGFPCCLSSSPYSTVKGNPPSLILMPLFNPIFQKKPWHVFTTVDPSSFWTLFLFCLSGLWIGLGLTANKSNPKLRHDGVFWAQPTFVCWVACSNL